MIDVLGPGGGFILAPCHVLQIDVPTENVCAMYETGYKYGVYDVKTSLSRECRFYVCDLEHENL
jgi:hypothetical protein